MSKDVCPMCRFPSRISGHVFISKGIADYALLESSRCKVCGHLPDYTITSITPKEAKIIYRNFTGSKEYFDKVKDYLKRSGFVLVGEGVA